ncbi:hypothetical protein SATMO3_16410 [Sporomusa aerivorans]
MLNLYGMLVNLFLGAQFHFKITVPVERNRFNS